MEIYMDIWYIIDDNGYKSKLIHIKMMLKNMDVMIDIDQIIWMYHEWDIYMYIYGYISWLLHDDKS